MDAKLSTNPASDPGRSGPSRAAPIIERAPLPMVEVEGPEHTVCFANGAFCRLLQRTREDLIGKRFEELVRNGEKCVPLLDKVYKTGEYETHVEVDGSDSDPAYWLYAMWPSLSDSAEAKRVVIQLTKATSFRQNIVAMNAELLIAGLRQHELRDEAEQANARSQSEIAERILAEVALLGANAKLATATQAAEQANRRKDEFFAALSHELRTPLAPVLIAAASLEQDPRLPSDARAQAGMIERNIGLEARLIDDLLDLTKISHGKLLMRPDACEVHTLIELAIEILKNEAHGKNVVIERTFTAQHSVLTVDPSRFQQVVWNLLRNAVKFSPRDSRVSIRTLDKNDSDAATWLRLEVADSGIGIDPAQLDQIFLPFEQGDRTGDHRFGGVGIGLAIARAIVLAHGGRITASSAGRNCGATFIAEFPRAVHPQRRAATDTALVSGNSAAPPGRILPLRLLVVDDDSSTLQAVSHLLQRDGHHVITAATAAEARAAAGINKFDFVISDLGLPDGNGADLMAELSSTRGLQGVALTGYGMEEDVARSREAGFLHHLVKPVSMAELRRVIALLPRPPPSARMSGQTTTSALPPREASR